MATAITRDPAIPASARLSRVPLVGAFGRIVGPAALTAAGMIGAGAVATRLLAGAWFGFDLLLGGAVCSPDSRALPMSATHGRTRIVRDIEDIGVVAVIRLNDARQLRSVAEALAEGGIRAIEVTMTVPGAVALIEELAASLTNEFVIGAGTVLDPETARQVILAGAKFVVSPVFKASLIEIGHKYDVPVMPGCFSPTEILSAWEAGADVVKVFPATVLGPSFFKDLRGPLPQLRLMPTGGVTRENAGDWIRAGAVAIGVGTALVDSKAVAERRFEVITANARHFIEAVQRARGSETGG